jgi:hypothetical protein
MDNNLYSIAYKGRPIYFIMTPLDADFLLRLITRHHDASSDVLVFHSLS